MALPTLEAVESVDRTPAESKAENKCPTKWANSWPQSPLRSFNLCGLKTSIGPLNINVLRTGNTFEPAQSCRIKEVPFKGLFAPDDGAQSRLFAL